MRCMEIGIKEIATIAESVSNYYSLASSFNQLDPKQYEKLTLFWEKNVLPYTKDKKYMDYDGNRAWKDIEFHFIEQSWANTACGWEGMGGAAISSSYTMVIENYNTKAAFIYYNGQLAYATEMNDKYNKYKEKGLRSLPGMRTAQKILDIIYTKKYE